MKKEKRGIWPWPILFILGMSFAVNALIIYHAFDSFKPLVVDNPYEKGLKYQDVVDQELRFLNSGWKFEFASDRSTSGDQILTATVVDEQGSAVEGLSIVVNALRPNASTDDRSIQLVASTDSYAATVPSLDSGLWLLSFAIKKGDNKYRHKMKYFAP